MGTKLTKLQVSALRRIKAEGVLYDGCRRDCFSIHSSTIQSLVAAALIDGRTSNPTAEQAWSLTDAGREALREASHDN